MVDTVILMDDKAKVAEPIKWISRWPAVMLAVSRTAKASGWIKRLIVSIIISIGIRGVGVPWGKKWANDILGLFRKPIITVPAHNGMAMPIFIDSWVVGVNEYGRSPSKLVEAINRIRDISMSVQVRPCLLCIVIICLVIRRISQICKTWIRFGSHRLGDDKIMHGNKIMIGRVVIPIIVGVINGANKFSFIFFLRGGQFL